MSRFLLKSKTAKEALEKQGSKKSNYKSFKMTGDTAQVLILPKIVWEDSGPDPFGDVPIFESVSHQMWKNNKFVASCASPEFDGEEDKLAQIGWDLRERYLEDSNEKLKDFFKAWLPNKTQYVNVLDLDDLDAGPQVLRLSGSMAEEVNDFITDLKKEQEDSEEMDFSSLCDFDEGAVFQIRSNGKPGIAVRYKCKFLNEECNLLKDGVIDDQEVEEIADKMYDLTKLQPKFDQEEYDNYTEKLMKKADILRVDVEGDFDSEAGSDDEFEASKGGDDSFEEDNSSDSFNEDDINFEEDNFAEDGKEDKEPAKEPEKNRTRSRSRNSDKKEDKEPSKRGRSRSRTSDKKEEKKEETSTRTRSRSRTRSRK